MVNNVTISFRKSRIQQIEQRYAKFMQEMVEFLVMMEGVEVLCNTENTISVAVQDSELNKTVQLLGIILTGRYGVKYPYRDMEITGDIDNLEGKDFYESSYSVGSVDEKRWEKETQERKKNGLRELPEGTVMKEYPVKYSPDMKSYIEEINAVAPMLQRMEMGKKFFSRHLLISIDEGWGYSAFLKAIYTELVNVGLTKNDTHVVPELEEVIKKPMDRDQKYRYWENAVSDAKSLRGTRKEESRKIVSYDIRYWIDDLDDPIVVQSLRKMTQYEKDYLCVFKIPYMEPQVVRRIADKLSEIMPIRTIAVPPLSLNDMFDYINSKLLEDDFRISDDCKELLERWICQERAEGRFFGFKSLDRMMDELIYHKALVGVENQENPKLITKSDIVGLVDDNEMDDPYKLLNELVGIAQVKSRVREIVAQIKMQKELQSQGTDVGRPGIHMIFTGNPGTGKTTVARIIGKIFREEGILRKGQFYEVHGRNLCGNYIGETAPKTSAICRDAYGSVLFIDEAYSLYVKDSERDYGKEAIHTLITEMENHRDEFCVIMAGYTDEMEELMTINPGLRSRIPYTIEFPNYTKEELVEIFFSMVNGRFAYEVDFREAVQDFFEKIPKEELEKKSFSNARFVRNLYERVWGKAAGRSDLNGKTELKLQKEDLIGASEEEDFKKMMTEKLTKRIGF